MDKIIRVFPERTNLTPDDEYAFIGEPPFQEMIPEHDEIHVSCIFTWDRAKCKNLAYQWAGRTNKPVKVGGPAFGSPAEGFQQGMYLKSDVTLTTRGCNNNCPWCIVPNIEGRLRELTIRRGSVLQDNNLLQANRGHKEKVFEMLRTQKGICFKGGLQASLVDDRFIDTLQSLYYTRGTQKISRVAELWLACDTDATLPVFKKACAKLVKIGFTRKKIKCYALIGDDREKNEARLQEIYNAGAMPFAQLYRDFSDTKTEYGGDWEAYARSWQRPAAIRCHMENGTDYRNFRT